MFRLRGIAGGVSLDRRERQRAQLVGPKPASKFNLPLSLLDRLLKSTVVPLEAKIKAVERWRLEIAEAHSSAPAIRELRSRLAHARHFLELQRSAASDASSLGIGNR
jgi:hypothetical protein